MYAESKVHRGIPWLQGTEKTVVAAPSRNAAVAHHMSLISEDYETRLVSVEEKTEAGHTDTWTQTWWRK